MMRCHFQARLGYKMTTLSTLGVTCSCSITWSAVREASCHTVNCPLDRPTWQRTEGGLLTFLRAQKKLRPSVQYPPREWILPRATRMSLEADLPPVKLSDETTAPMIAYLQTHKRPCATGTHISSTETSNPQKLT